MQFRKSKRSWRSPGVPLKSDTVSTPTMIHKLVTPCRPKPPELLFNWKQCLGNCGAKSTPLVFCFHIRTKWMAHFWHFWLNPLFLAQMSFPLEPFYRGGLGHKAHLAYVYNVSGTPAAVPTNWKTVSALQRAAVDTSPNTNKCLTIWNQGRHQLWRKQKKQHQLFQRMGQILQTNLPSGQKNNSNLKEGWCSHPDLDKLSRTIDRFHPLTVCNNLCPEGSWPSGQGVLHDNNAWHVRDSLRPCPA